MENPIPEPLTLQHEVIQRMFSDAVPLTEQSHIPVFIPESKDLPAGIWTLWELSASNQYATRSAVHPLFFSDEGDLFPAFANDLLIKISQSSLGGKISGTARSTEGDDLASLALKAEEALDARYGEMEAQVIETTDRIRTNKAKAFEFQARQIGRIGIESIRNYRLQRLDSERSEWTRSYSASARVVPDLVCLVALRISHE
ncbi:MAG: hypothetical protein ACOYM2_10750 [Rectinemataceae bacterium]